jgi:hypothetical protein
LTLLGQNDIMFTIVVTWETLFSRPWTMIKKYIIYQEKISKDWSDGHADEIYYG